MALRSLAVRPGDDVGIGQRIGRVGLSGLTEFPHLHFTVRRSGRVVDPFALDAERGSCGSGRSLWSDEFASRRLATQAGSVINALARGPVTMDAHPGRETAQVEPGNQLSALVAFVRAIGLRARDVQRLTLADPAGTVIAETGPTLSTQTRPSGMVFSVSGARHLDGAPAPTRPRYTVERAGATALDHRFSIELKP